MKRIFLSFVLLGILAVPLTLTGCGNNNSNEPRIFANVDFGYWIENRTQTGGQGLPIAWQSPFNGVIVNNYNSVRFVVVRLNVYQDVMQENVIATRNIETTVAANSQMPFYEIMTTPATLGLGAISVEIIMSSMAIPN